MGKVLVIDYTICNGCYNCQVACKDEHVGNDWSPIAKPQPDTGQFWNKIDDMVRVNVAALTTLTRLVLPGMIERGRGGVLNVASVAGFMSGPHAATYYATKNYVLALSEALAHEVASAGVTVSALCPGPVATGFQDRSGQGDSLVKGPMTMDAASVARTGWSGFRSGKRVIVPGVANKIFAQLPRVAPRRLLSHAIGRVQDI